MSISTRRTTTTRTTSGMIFHFCHHRLHNCCSSLNVLLLVQLLLPCTVVLAHVLVMILLCNNTILYGDYACFVVSSFTLQSPLLVPQPLPYKRKIQQTFISTTTTTTTKSYIQQVSLSSSSMLFSSSSSSSSNVGSSIAFIEDYLQDRYPNFVTLLLNIGNPKDDDATVWKQLTNALIENGGFTLFIPNNIEQLVTDKVIQQLQDSRNYETTKQIALYHCINEIVTAEQIYNSGGLITLGGIVDIHRKNKGGILGTISALFGGGGNNNNDDNDNIIITLNDATIVDTVLLGNSECMIYEVSNFISPKLLWRYMDQLRIPGSK